MSQSGAVQPVHSRRHRPEMNQNNANEPIAAAAAAVARFGETEWEARDVSNFVLVKKFKRPLTNLEHILFALIFPRNWIANGNEMQSQRQRELEEARARASQMEKTMKWW